MNNRLRCGFMMVAIVPGFNPAVCRIIVLIDYFCRRSHISNI
ncbi:hypothetical protein [Scopulibacillus daqui]|nr:hypothetical protein [Scopulibacillus daqui]